MKRSRLKRKTPLARGTKRLNRTPLARVSVTKATWRELYRMKRDGERKPIMTCADCLGIFPGDRMEPHHPGGQQKGNILVFVWVDRRCHARIHDNGTWARETGRITKEFEGRKSQPGDPNYFGVTFP